MKRNLNLDPDLETLVSSPGVRVRTGPYIPLYSQPQWVLPRAANNPSVFTFTITEKAPPRAFSWLKTPTSSFTFKTLI